MKNILVTHMVCGYPNNYESKKLLKVLVKYSKYVEIQFPFSDPIADGELISKANEESLKNGLKTKDCFDFIEDNKCFSSQLIIMTYYNIVYKYGIAEFIIKAKSLGIYGIIIPDIPFDEIEGKKLIKICSENDLNLIYVVAPNTSQERLKSISKFSTGFIYAVSRNMTTGNEILFGKDFESYINNLKKIFNIPVGVGFGIKKREHINRVCKISDYAIIGTEVLYVYEKKGIEGVNSLLRSFCNN